MRSLAVAIALIAVLPLPARSAFAQVPPPQRAKPATDGGVFLQEDVDEPPKMISSAPPEYPPAMRQAQITGRVTVVAVIDTSGAVEPGTIQITQRPDYGFDASVRDYFMHARFSPGRLHGIRVRVLVTIPIDFALPGVPPPAPPPIPEAVRPQAAAMRQDLRSLIVAEEDYFVDSVRYTGLVGALRFAPSPGVTVRIDSVTADAWRGTATHRDAPGWTCGVFVGDIPAYLRDQAEGKPLCWKTPAQ
jgi:TonB family protein